MATISEPLRYRTFPSSQKVLLDSVALEHEKRHFPTIIGSVTAQRALTGISIALGQFISER